MTTSTTQTFSPRYDSSRQWTALPNDFVAKVEEVFAKQFDIEALNGEFLIEGRIYPQEVIVRAGYLESGRLKQINFEASVDLPKATPEEDDSESKTMELLYLCIDALGSLMEEYFELGEEDEIDVPFSWRAYEFEGQTVYLKHSTVNSRLEEEADRLLGLDDKNLFNEEQSSEDALAKAEVDSDLAFEVQKAIRAGKFNPVSSSENLPSDESNEVN